MFILEVNVSLKTYWVVINMQTLQNIFTYHNTVFILDTHVRIHNTYGAGWSIGSVSQAKLIVARRIPGRSLVSLRPKRLISEFK